MKVSPKFFSLFLILPEATVAMDNTEDFEAALSNLIDIVRSENSNRNCGDSLLGLMGSLKLEIPADACNLLFNSGGHTSLLENVFLGFSPLDFKEIEESYRYPNSPNSPFHQYLVDDKFNAIEGRAITMEDDLAGDLDTPIEICNLRSLVPIFRFQDDYLFLNLATDNSSLSGLIVTTYASLGNMLAPSISEHLEDLLLGLESNRYRVVEGLIVYPTSWYLRKKVMSGELDVDEYGEIVEDLE